MKYTLQLKGSDRVLESDNPIEVASILRIPLTIILRLGESCTHNGWTALRIQ
jgi:hypothetical protein